MIAIVPVCSVTVPANANTKSAAVPERSAAIVSALSVIALDVAALIATSSATVAAVVPVIVTVGLATAVTNAALFAAKSAAVPETAGTIAPTVVLTVAPPKVITPPDIAAAYDTLFMISVEPLSSIAIVEISVVSSLARYTLKTFPVCLK